MPSVQIREVGPRDGLQLVRSFLPTERKLEWCALAVAAGVSEIEVTSFVPPSVVPQFADAAAVVASARDVAGLTVTVLVPNPKGALRAFEAGAHKVNIVVSASEAHNRANVNRSVQQSLDDFARVIEARAAGAPSVKIAGCVATAFGCSIQGEVPERDVFSMLRSFIAAGADELVIADTVGYGNPVQVERILSEAVSMFAGPIYAHFHDTRGLGLANVAAAIKSGVTRFDASLGGLGGCPFAPGATGNIDTEDCAFLLESMGFDTGIDIEKLVELRARVARWLPDETFYGAVARAGLPKTFRILPLA